MELWQEPVPAKRMGKHFPTYSRHMQATSARHYGEKDARLEYLSWRVWFMKRNRALAKADAQQRAAAGIVDDVSRPHADDETSDDEQLLPANSTGSKGVSFKLPKKEPSLQKVISLIQCPSYPCSINGGPAVTFLGWAHKSLCVIFVSFLIPVRSLVPCAICNRDAVG